MPGFFNRPSLLDNSQIQTKKDIYKPKFTHNDQLGDNNPKSVSKTTTLTTVGYSVIPIIAIAHESTTTTSTTTTTTTQTRQPGEIVLRNTSSHVITKSYDSGTTGNLSFTASIPPNTIDDIILSSVGNDAVSYIVTVSATYSLVIGIDSNNEFIPSDTVILQGLTAQEADSIYQSYGSSTFTVGNEISSTDPQEIGIITINNNSSYNLNIYNERQSTSNQYVSVSGQTFTYSRYDDMDLVRFHGTIGESTYPSLNPTISGIQVTFSGDNQWRPFMNSHNNLDYKFSYILNGQTTYNGFNTIGDLVFDVVDYDINSYPLNFSLYLGATQGVITGSTVEKFINDNPSVIINMNDFWYTGAYGITTSVSAVSRQETIRYTMLNSNTGSDISVIVNSANPVTINNNQSQNFYTVSTPINIVATNPNITTTSTTSTTSTSTTTTTTTINTSITIINNTSIEIDDAYGDGESIPGGSTVVLNDLYAGLVSSSNIQQEPSYLSKIRFTINNGDVLQPCYNADYGTSNSHYSSMTVVFGGGGQHNQNGGVFGPQQSFSGVVGQLNFPKLNGGDVLTFFIVEPTTTTSTTTTTTTIPQVATFINNSDIELSYENSLQSGNIDAFIGSVDIPIVTTSPQQIIRIDWSSAITQQIQQSLSTLVYSINGNSQVPFNYIATYDGGFTSAEVNFGGDVNFYPPEGVNSRVGPIINANDIVIITNSGTTTTSTTTTTTTINSNPNIITITISTDTPNDGTHTSELFFSSDGNGSPIDITTTDNNGPIINRSISFDRTQSFIFSVYGSNDDFVNNSTFKVNGNSITPQLFSSFGRMARIDNTLVTLQNGDIIVINHG